MRYAAAVRAVCLFFCMEVGKSFANTPPLPPFHLRKESEYSDQEIILGIGVL